jgi:protein involved in polysaccharide export with SLBB domain
MASVEIKLRGVPPSVTRTIFLTLLLALPQTGCWTRLTTPKESFLYQPADQANDPVQTAKVLTAPQYQEVLRKIEAKDGPLEYRLVVGTRVNVEVYGHGIKESVNIRPDGMVDLPLIGDVRAEGRTIPMMKKEVSELYKPFFQQEPQIIINTDRDNDLSGGVKAGDVSVINPRASGGYSMFGAGVVNITGDERLSQILASVHALTTDTEWRQIAVIRRSRDQKDSVIILCDVESLIKYGDVRQDILMRNGDIVFIPIERNTLIQEIWATFSLVAQITSNANTITDYIERIERY